MPKLVPPPVQVRFTGLYQPDMSALAESLVPFGRWSEEHIAAHLPVVVSYPTKIAQRLKVLEGYLAPGGWPPQVPSDAMRTMHSIVEQMMPQVEAEITRGVRLMAAAAIRDDGSRAAAVRDEVLSTFLASKMLATARTLQAFRLVGEPILEWGAEFYEMSSVYSNRLIYGLSFLAHEPHGWAGWTDADLWVEEERCRLFAPICPAPRNAIDKESFLPEDVRRLIIPQLLCPEIGHLSFFTIRRLVFEPWATFLPHLILRDEIFIDAETCKDHSNAKAYVARIAAGRIASQLQQIPSNERWREFIRLSIPHGSLSFDIAGLVKEKISFS